MTLTDEVIAKTIRDQRDELLKQVAKYDSILLALGAENKRDQEKRDIIHATNFKETPAPSNIQRPFKSWIVQTLKEAGRAMYARELLDAYNTHYNTQKEMRSFAARMSETSGVRCYVNEGRPYLYGLPQWFKGKMLDNAYNPNYKKEETEKVEVVTTHTSSGKKRTHKKSSPFINWLSFKFKDGKPKTANMLLNLYNAEVNKNVDIKTFRVKLTEAKRTKTVKSFKPIGLLSFYGPAAWFDKTGLKPEYMALIQPGKNRDTRGPKKK